MRKATFLLCQLCNLIRSQRPVEDQRAADQPLVVMKLRDILATGYQSLGELEQAVR